MAWIPLVAALAAHGGRLVGDPFSLDLAPWAIWLEGYNARAGGAGARVPARGRGQAETSGRARRGPPP